MPCREGFPTPFRATTYNQPSLVNTLTRNDAAQDVPRIGVFLYAAYWIYRCCGGRRLLTFSKFFTTARMRAVASPLSKNVCQSENQKQQNKAGHERSQSISW